MHNRSIRRTTKRQTQRSKKRNNRSLPFFNCKQEHNEPLEKFHSRIKQKAALCNWEYLKDSLVKSIFIQGMRNPQIQMDLLSEDRGPIGTLQYALAGKRGQENQQKMTNPDRSHFDTNPQGQFDVQYIRRNNTQPRQNTQQRTGILQTPKSGPIQTAGNVDINLSPGTSATAQQRMNCAESAKR